MSTKIAISDIENKITTFLDDGKLVHISKFREILRDILSNFGSNSPILFTYAISKNNVNLSTFSAGMSIANTEMSLGSTFIVFGQNNPSEIGMYVVGSAPGETLRHPDFPDSASISGKLILSENPDEDGNVLLNIPSSGYIPIVMGTQERTIYKVLTNGENIITWRSPMVDSNYFFLGHAYDGDGNVIHVSIYDQTENQFKVNIGSSGTIEGKIIKRQ